MDAGKPADQRARLLPDASRLGRKIRWLDEQAATSPGQTTFDGVTYPTQVPYTPAITGHCPGHPAHRDGRAAVESGRVPRRRARSLGSFQVPRG
ncbi:hypothetical protein [Actinomadura nitritigenes]|uniref:hypothetical protein n=1 Tax=Actinomadura nitritigenes TaxID=134602 RepID=UPI003D8CE977